MPQLDRDGLHLHYDVHGPRDTGIPSPQGVLLAHGMTGTGAADWSRLLPHLAPDFRCVVPDLRGHGRSDFRAGDFGYRRDARGPAR